MDPKLGGVLSRLFSHQTCSRLRYTEARRSYYDSSSSSNKTWQQRTDFFPPDKLQEFQRAPMVTAASLRHRRERPRRVKMLARDFMDDSLYNPTYGYFPKQATIFSPGEPFDFSAMADEEDFQRQLGQRYTAFEDRLDRKQYNESRQLWHTPTELFRPYYGEAIARYLVTNYKLSHHPYHDLIIYEVGAGNGTLMLNILDHIRDFHPDVYPRTKFKIIEISASLAALQTAQLASSQGHRDHVEIINRSIFNWDMYVPTPCYFLALEVFDNFAHDIIRYDPATEKPLQGQVLIDRDGAFFEFYTPHLDSAAQRFLRTRQAACMRKYRHPLREASWIRRLRANLPMAANLTQPEYIPTRLLQFFETLYDYFPMHHLLAADFHALPDAVPGLNAPVVQTRYKRRTVPVSTPYVLQGYFDILFPTDFAVMEDLYRAVTGKLTKVTTQTDWLQRWAYTDDTRCRSGENPMLSW